MIEKKQKICKCCGKLSYIFSHGECKWCANKRYLKKKVDNQKVNKKEYNDFCRELWGERDHVSELSGQRLPEYDFHSPKFCNLIRFHLHHYKPKSKYPALMLEKSNIVFLTRDEHYVVEFGSEKQKEEIGWLNFIQNYESKIGT